MPNPPVVIDQFNLVVSDMQRSVEFYRLLGLIIPDTLPEWQDHHRTATFAGSDFHLDLDSAEFAGRWNQGWPGGAGGPMGVLGLRLPTREDVDGLARRVSDAGFRIQQEPYDAFWGARYAVVEDPDGNAVGLMSQVDQTRRKPPPEPPG